MQQTSKGVFIATQLNSTQLNSTRQREQQLTQFVGRDVINKNTYKHPLKMICKGFVVI